MRSHRLAKAAIAWRRTVGSLQSRCGMVEHRDAVIVGTCGSEWNARDGDDGVHCLDLASGDQRWFTPTLGDVNEIALAGDDLIVPTDTGDVLILDAKVGRIKSILTADAAVVGRPLVTMATGGWQAVFASTAGTIYGLENDSSALRTLGGVDAPVLAAVQSLGHDGILIAPTDGRIMRAHFGRAGLEFETIAQVPLTEGAASLALSATPTLHGDLVLVGYSRDTYYDHPAVSALNFLSGEVAWSQEKIEIGGGFGNCRSSPLVMGDALAVCSAYTDGIDILDVATGSVRGHVRLGQTVFQQWSSPVRLDERHLAIGRVDGVISVIDVHAMELTTSVSVSTADAEAGSGSVDADDGDEPFALYPGQPAPDGAICATPLVTSHGALLAGTTSGELVRIDLRLTKTERSLN